MHFGVRHVCMLGAGRLSSPWSKAEAHAGTAAAVTTPRSCGAANRASRHAPAVAAAFRQARAPGTAFSAMSTDARSSRAILSSPRLGPAASVVHQVMAFCRLALATVPASSAGNITALHVVCVTHTEVPAIWVVDCCMPSHVCEHLCPALPCASGHCPSHHS